jgi:phage baseplate assembly protein W
MILSTVKGERVLRPEFGCQIHDLVFAPNDTTTTGLAAYHVEQALGMWEPRIRVIHVDVQPAERRGDSMLLISISYEIKATLDQRTLVYPFYRIPGE